MSEIDGEIEYLDEDAEIVQKCVEVPLQRFISLRRRLQPVISKPDRLLVERSVPRRKRKNYSDNDSDYNPEDDKKKTYLVKKPKLNQTIKIGNTSITRTSNVCKTPIRTPIRYIKTPTASIADLRKRKKMNIHIPDYDDPLCLPVRALKKTGSDVQRLRNWNNVCLEHFKHANTLLRPEKGETHSSTRSIVLRNVVHKETGKQELAVWSKTSVENNDGVRKSEIFQSILPKYRERKVLTNFTLNWTREEMKFRNVSDVILSTEEHNNEKVLVAYNATEKVSAVYKCDSIQKKSETGEEDEDPKICLKEVICCQLCAPCFQTSWRGTKKDDQRSIRCPICQRASVSVYNLLTHLKGHNAQDVRAHRRAISVALSKVVDYHYRCRVCLQQFHSIKTLRRHVLTHKGSETFKCEVGSHMAM